MLTMAGIRLGSLPLIVLDSILLTSLCSAVHISGETSNLLVGGELRLTCRSGPLQELIWLHNGMIVNNPQYYEVISTRGQTSSSTTVIVRSLTMQDSGSYMCRNRAYETDYVDIHIRQAPTTRDVEIVDPTVERLELHEGASLSLKCKGTTSSRLQWRYNGAVLLESTPGGRIIITQSLDFVTGMQISLLSRENMSPVEAGVYACVDEGNPLSKDNVTVVVAPSEDGVVPVSIYEPSASTLKVKVAHMLELKCKSDASTQLEWTNDDVLLDGRTNVNIIDSVDEVTGMRTSWLSIAQAVTSDAGVYCCQEVNNTANADHVTVSIETQVVGLHMGGQFPISRRTYKMMVGSVINLTCSFQSTTTHHLEWTKDGHPLGSGSKYNIEQEDSLLHTLIIQNTDEDDAGLYQCSFKHRETGVTTGVIIFNVTTVVCPSPRVPVHGGYTQCPERPLFGDSCTFHCDPGFRPSHTQTLYCQMDEQKNTTQWSSPAPRCHRMTQEEINAQIPSSMSNVLLRAGGVQRLQCNSRGTWSREGRGVIHSGGKYTVDDIAGALSIHDTTSTDIGVYHCTLRHQNLSRILGIKKYNVSTLLCPPLEKPLNGSIELCSRQPVYGEICMFRCDHGFKLSGSRSRICDLTDDHQHVYWTGDSPQCQGSRLTKPSPGDSDSNKSTSSAATISTHLFTVITYCLSLTVIRWRLGTL